MAVTRQPIRRPAVAAPAATATLAPRATALAPAPPVPLRRPAYNFASIPLHAPGPVIQLGKNKDRKKKKSGQPPTQQPLTANPLLNALPPTIPPSLLTPPDPRSLHASAASEEPEDFADLPPLEEVTTTTTTAAERGEESAEQEEEKEYDPGEVGDLESLNLGSEEGSADKGEGGEEEESDLPSASLTGEKAVKAEKEVRRRPQGIGRVRLGDVDVASSSRQSKELDRKVKEKASKGLVVANQSEAQQAVASLINRKPHHKGSVASGGSAREATHSHGNEVAITGATNKAVAEGKITRTDLQPSQVRTQKKEAEKSASAAALREGKRRAGKASEEARIREFWGLGKDEEITSEHRKEYRKLLKGDD